MKNERGKPKRLAGSGVGCSDLFIAIAAAKVRRPNETNDAPRRLVLSVPFFGTPKVSPRGNVGHGLVVEVIIHNKGLRGSNTCVHVVHII